MLSVAKEIRVLSALIPSLVVFTTLSIVDIYNYRYIFGELFGESGRGGWLGYAFTIYYFAVTYAYCISQNYGSRILYAIFFVLFYFKVAPFICYKYGIKVRHFLIIALYVQSVDAIAQTILLLIGINGTMDNARLLLDNVFSMIVRCFIMIIFMLIRYSNRKTKISILLKYLKVHDYLILIALLYSSGVVENLMFHTQLEKQYEVIMRLFSFCEVIFSIMVTINVVTVRKRQVESDMAYYESEREVVSMKDLFERLEEKELITRKFRHDIKNHLIILKAMNERKEINRVSEYINDMYEICDAGSKKYNTGNIICDSLLNSKGADVEENVLISVTGMMPDRGISDIDMTIIFSNLLDNAVEAVSKHEKDALISIHSDIRGNIWNLTIVNPIYEPVKKIGREYKTTKNDAAYHGYGLLNIRSTVEKYNGSIALLDNDGLFTARLTLRLTEIL